MLAFVCLLNFLPYLVTYFLIVLLQWQEFNLVCGGVFLTCHRGGGAGGEYLNIRPCQS